MVYRRTQQGGASEDSTVTAKLQELLSTIQVEEETSKKTQLSSDRLAYQAEAEKCLGNSDEHEGGVVAMETEASSEVVTSGACVRYGEMVENIQVPLLVESFRKRLHSIAGNSGTVV